MNGAPIAGRPLHRPGRIALVGAGAFGRFCIEAYEESGDLAVVSVADPDPDALAQVVAPGARLERDWRLLVADESVEVIHVATPPFLRGAVVDAALAARKSVFVEKPLALSLPEADAMIAASGRSGTALGVNYVMRRLPAYDLLERLGASGLFGALRTVSFQNYAQTVPAWHWFWDQAKSGGILVEHGVHFFDAYSRIAGQAREVWGMTPRSESIEAGVRYEGGAVGRFYHEFAFPKTVERATGIAAFERGWVEIDGWIPTELRGAALAAPEAVEEVARGTGVRLDVESGETVTFGVGFGDRQERYRAAVVAGMRDLVWRHRDPGHQMAVTPAEARASLAVALAAREAAATGRVLPVPAGS